MPEAVNTGAETRPLSFGICRNQTWPYPDLVGLFRRAEALGFDSAWVADHFQRPSEPDAPYFEGWTLLAALAAQTSRIRIGTLVTSNSFRHPALVAKMAMTVDHISGGRLELGFGTGWYEGEHRRYGLHFPEPRERVARFAEAVEVIDRLLRNDTATFTGDYYRLDEAPMRPAPVQRPRPPLTLGAHGPKMLAIVARYADRWNSFGSVAEIRERNARLDEACAAIGRNPREIVRSFYGMAPRETMANRLTFDPWESPDAFRHMVGTYREVGIEGFIIDGPEAHQIEMMGRIATDVIPALRAESAEVR